MTPLIRHIFINNWFAQLGSPTVYRPNNNSLNYNSTTDKCNFMENLHLFSEQIIRWEVA